MKRRSKQQTKREEFDQNKNLSDFEKEVSDGVEGE